MLAPRTVSNASKKIFSDAQRNYRVTVVGAAGGIGQSLSLLLKLNPTGLITSLNLYDLAPVTPGVAVDLSHIATSAKVTGFTGAENLGTALKDADIVVVPAGVPRKPGMTRDDLFNINANINAGLAAECAKQCPNASYLVISNPVNSNVPIWAKALQEAGVYNPKKLYGVTTLDISRANTFASEKAGHPVHVPVVGGHAGTTIVPLFSMAEPAFKLEGEALDAMTHRVAFGGDEVVQAKAGAGSATLSMAAAGAKFTESILRALSGQKVEKEIAYVENPIAEKKYGTRFFATQIDIAQDGISKIHDSTATASKYEAGLIEAMIGDLKNQISKGDEFALKK